MGICLDTDASAAQDTAEQGNDWSRSRNPNSAQIGGGGGGRIGGSASVNAIDIQNAGKIKFDPPKVPVIFVLGGPGSGKVTHCDTFMQERRGVTHINMMDLLQQYAMGNDMQDFSQLSSKTVTEVLMLEMKMAPAAKAYLISGYPRSMRDVVEYSEKIQMVNGVVLISWRQSVLQKQIDYGAKLGHVVLSLAKMELENFFKNVMPVADYFDQSDMLLAVNGERAPAEVYKDFRAAILDVLNSLENQEAILNGVTGMGRGINDIPGSIVSVDTAPRQDQNSVEPTGITNTTTTTTTITTNTTSTNNNNNTMNLYKINNNVSNNYRAERNVTDAVIAHVASSAANAVARSARGVMAMGGGGGGGAGSDDPSVITRQPQKTNAATSIMSGPDESIPPVLWVIGGPGSNKAVLCMRAVSLNPGWGHISVGRLLRQITDSSPRANTENYAIKEALSAGEMAPEKAIDHLLETNIRQMHGKAGIVIDGFPRNLQQVKFFENKYKQIPPVILLDCSKLQLGRGRIDDTVSSFRRRLELFRELTLPMLKAMDSSNRLQIVDGDTDSPSVQREFERIIRGHVQAFEQKGLVNNVSQPYDPAKNANAVPQNSDTIVQDLENNMPGAVPTISHHVSLMNGHLKNQRNPSAGASGMTMNNLSKPAVNHKPTMNGDVRPGQQMDFRHMLEEAERYPVDSYM